MGDCRLCGTISGSQELTTSLKHIFAIHTKDIGEYILFRDFNPPLRSHGHFIIIKNSRLFVGNVTLKGDQLWQNNSGLVIIKFTKAILNKGAELL